MTIKWKRKTKRTRISREEDRTGSKGKDAKESQKRRKKERTRRKEERKRK